CNNTYAADRWITGIAGSDTFSISKNSANREVSSQFCAAVTFTLSGGAGNSAFYQKLEDFSQLQGKTITFSIRAFASVVNSVRPAIYDSTNGWRYGSFNTQTAGYETLTASFALPNGISSVQVGVFFAASATVYLDNAMLVMGSMAADYAPL